jgi:excinuclease UvrABC helicase subunit UvrB
LPGHRNYSRHLTAKAGEPPPTLLSYFPNQFLLFIDESHVTVPQIGGMYRGDRSRKETLSSTVPFAFGLGQSPFEFCRVRSVLDQVIYVSATRRTMSWKKPGAVVEQLIRPTGLTDPSWLCVRRAIRWTIYLKRYAKEPSEGTSSGNHFNQKNGRRSDGLLPRSKR